MSTHHSYRTTQHCENVQTWLNLFPGTWIAAYDDDKRDPATDPQRTNPKLQPQSGFQYNPQRFDEQYGRMCDWSKKGYGIFFTPNRCIGGTKKENCKGINAYYCDLDEKNGTANEHIERIKVATLKPEIVIQSSAGGHHCYWLSQNGTLENFDAVEAGIVHALKGDENAKDVVRRMRIPFFLNQKPEHGEPFMPRIIEGIGYIIDKEQRPPGYMEKEMMGAFPVPQKEEKISKESADIIRVSMGFWDAAASIDNMTALKVLSGKPEVKNEVFSFKKNSNGTQQILANGKSTSCWIDHDGHIGSHDKGGPTYIQWLEWYGLSKGDIAKAIKMYLHEHLPEHKEGNAAKSYTFVTWYDLVERAYQRKNSINPAEVCKYHLKPLDDLLGGILPTDLVTIGADTGCGKSDLLLHIAIGNAERGKRVLYYQLEMDEEEIVDRKILTAANRELGEGWIPAKNYRINDMQPDQRAAYERAKAAVQKMGGDGRNIVVYEGGALSFDGFLESLNVTRQMSFDLIVLDHLHYFSMDGGSDSMAQNLAKVMRNIRIMVKKYRIPVVVASHIRKLHKADERPRILDLYGSGDIAKESTAVLMLHREGNETFVYIEKSRGTGHRDHEIKLYYDERSKSFTDTPPEGDAPKKLPFLE